MKTRPSHSLGRVLRDAVRCLVHHLADVHEAVRGVLPAGVVAEAVAVEPVPVPTVAVVPPAVEELGAAVKAAAGAATMAAMAAARFASPIDAIDAVASAATASAAVMSFLDLIISGLLGSERGASLPSPISGTIEAGRPARCDGHHENVVLATPCGRARTYWAQTGENTGHDAIARHHTARAEPRTCDFGVARPAALGRHRVDRPAGGAAPTLRQRRRLCGRGVGTVIHRADLALRPARPAAAQRAQRRADRRRAGAAVLAPARRECRRHQLHRADQHRPALRGVDARHHQRSAHLLHACRCHAVLLRHPELETVPWLLLLRRGAADACAQLRTGRRLAAAERRPAARYRLKPHADQRGHAQRRADLLRARAGQPGRGRAGAAIRAFRGADRDRDAGADRRAAQGERESASPTASRR